MLALVVAALSVAAFTVDMFLAVRESPRRGVYAWLAWSAPGAACGVLVGSFGGGWVEMGAYAVAGAVLAYPALRLAMWLNDARYGSNDWGSGQAPEPPPYRALDLSPAPAATSVARSSRSAPPADTTPLTMAASGAVLERATRERRPKWAPFAEWLVVAFAVIAIVATLGWLEFHRYRRFDDNGARGAVAAALEAQGYGAPRVISRISAVRCLPGSAAYRWAAIGAEGRACFGQDDGAIHVDVDRTWPSDRPGSDPPPGVEPEPAS